MQLGFEGFLHGWCRWTISDAGANIAPGLFMFGHQAPIKSLVACVDGELLSKHWFNAGVFNLLIKFGVRNGNKLLNQGPAIAHREDAQRKCVGVSQLLFFSLQLI